MTRSAKLPQPEAGRIFGHTKRLVRVLDAASTLRLLEHRGGTVVKIPRRAGGILAEILAPEAVRKLIAEFGGGTEISLPMPDKMLAVLRNQQIYDEHHANGESLMTLALRHRLTVSMIKKILRKMGRPKRSEKQADLFGEAA